MRKMKLFGFVLVLVFLLGGVFAINSGGYTYSNPKVSGSSGIFTSYNENFGSTFYDTSFFDGSMCEEGQDFLVRVDESECSPTIVRSDLLEEEEIPVFCPVQAIKINPLIDISSIDSISFSGDYPPSVKTVGFTPVYSALGGNRKLNNYQWDNIGYVTVILRHNPNESSMPDFVDLNLTARINYDLRGGFGLMTHSFYLPVMDDSTFEEQMGKYAFFNHMGYVRADVVEEDAARISIYRDLYQNPMDASSEAKQRLQSFDLNVGESSPKITLPGFECLSKVKFTLKSIDYADTSAKFLVNSEYIDVRDEQTFLDGLCKVKDVDNMGIYQSTRVSCETDEGIETFDLRVSPKMVFEVDGDEVEASLGDKIGTSKEGKDLFFAYLGEKNNILQALVIAVPAEKGKEELSDSDLILGAYLGENGLKKASTIRDILDSASSGAVELYKYLQAGDTYALIPSEGEEGISGSRIGVVSLGLKKNEVMNREIIRGYEDSIQDYDRVISNYLGEKYQEEDVVTLAETAIYEKIALAGELMQYEDVRKFCLEFEQDFSASTLEPELCRDDLFLANEDVSVKNVLIDGDYKRIVFNGVYEPELEDFGAVLLVRNLNTRNVQTYALKKNTNIILNDTSGESLSLSEVDDNSIEVSLNLRDMSLSSRAGNLVSSTKTLVKGVPRSFNGEYEFVVQDVYLKKVAYVEVKPSVNYQSSEADFNYKIGIEKRSIQLSPEKAMEIAEKVNNTIQTLESISSGLDFVTSRMKEACLATGGYLTLKNILFSKDGETIARGEVMGEWEKTCSKLVPGEYRSLESCYLDNADEIDSQVEEISKIMASQESEFEGIISSSNLVLKEGGFFGQTIVNETALAIEFTSAVISDLNGLKGIEGTSVIESPTKSEESIDLDKVISVLEDESKADVIYDMDNLKLIDRYYQLYSSSKEDIYYSKLYSAIEQIVVNDEEYLDYVSSRKLNDESMGQSKVLVASAKNAKVGTYYGYKTKEGDGIWGKGEIPESTLYMQQVQLPDGNTYYVSLSPSGIGQGEYNIKTVYDSLGSDLASAGVRIVSEYYSVFELENAGSYSYEIAGSDYVVRYYEAGSYKGLPALVPFDKSRGWYAQIENSLTSTSSYADSGRIQSFKLCNVMDDGLIGSEDECITVSLSSSKYADFPGLDSAETQQLIDRAVKSISAAGQAQNRKGAIRLPNGESVPVGQPYSSSVSKNSCSDFMSPKECQLLFNLCDPVICPESRCDYGGKYPVQDVVQSGIVGSLMLCAPNANEGIKVPVCLSGVNAGVKGLTSVTESYRDCLVESAQTGQTVGICDEIHSIYMCEFVWKQAIPLAKIAAPAVLTKVIEGDTVRGGGEYFSVKDAWKNAQESMNYFTESYAVQSYKAFKARSQDQVGTEVCKNFVSVAFPSDLGSLSVLAESDNPPQFIASFEEIPYSSATNPAMSQYKVYYHVYAGEDSGVYYSIYLRGTDSSYYEDAAVGRRVDSGYIQSGGYASQTVDFLGPVGYEQLCVRINDEQEECGFGKVSTSFAVNYLSDAYIDSQAGQTDITTEKECISGTSNLRSLLNLNVQNGVENVIDPNIAEDGIIRICATSNPGIGSDPNYGDVENQKWLDVGYCGDESLRCWIDTQSLEDSFEWEYSYNQTLNSSLADAYEAAVDKYLDKENYWSEEEFDSFIDNNLTSNLDSVDKIILINEAFTHVYFNNHKAKLLLERARAYGEIVIGSWREYWENKQKAQEEEEKDSLISVDKTDILDVIGARDYISPVISLGSFDGEVLFVKYFAGKGWKYYVGTNIGESLILPGADSSISYDELDALRYFERNGSMLDNEIGSGSNEMKSFLKILLPKDYSDGINTIFDLMGEREENVYGIEEILSNSGKLSVDDEQVFEFNDGDNLIYFVYYGGEWKWSFSREFDFDEWQSMDESYQEVPSILQSLWNGVKAPTTWLGITKDSRTGYVFPEEYDPLRNALFGVNEIIGNLILLEGEEFWDQEGFVVVADSQYDELISKYSKQYSVSPYLVKGVIKQESNFNPYAVSVSGAAGLMQFVSGTTQRNDLKDILSAVEICSNECSCGVNCDETDVVELCGCFLEDDRFNPEKSINAGSKYLSVLLNQFSSSENPEEFALAAYNGGPTMVGKLVSEIERDGEELTWSNAKIYLDAEFLKNNGYSLLNNAERERKVKEIINYVNNVLLYKRAYENADLVIDSGFDLPSTALSGPGEIILEIAESKVGEDTVRKDGSYDKPCASFVSNVLIEAGAIADNCYSEAVTGLHSEFLEDSEFIELTQTEWFSLLMPGDILIWGGDTSKGWKPEFQHITIFSGYDQNGNFRVIHDGGELNTDGTRKEIEEKTYSLSAHNSGAWYITHAWRYEGEVVSSFVEVSGETDYVVLLDAVVLDWASLMELIEESPSLVNKPNSDGSYALHLAVSRDNLEIVKYLVGKGAMVNLEDADGNTALDYALTGGNEEIINYLISQGAEEGNGALDIPENYAVPSSGSSGGESVSLELTDEIEDLENNGWPIEGTLDFCDSLSGKYSSSPVNKMFVDKIYSEGIISENEYEKLIGEGSYLWFIPRGEGDMSDVYELLVEKRQELISGGQTKFFVDALDIGGKLTTDTVEEYERLLNEGMNLNWRKLYSMVEEYPQLVNVQTENSYQTILYAAISRQDLSRAKNLIELGADVDIEDSIGNTLLHYASWQYRLEDVEFLVGEGADLNKVNVKGQTPLDLALERVRNPSYNDDYNYNNVNDYAQSIVDYLEENGAKRASEL